MEKVVRFIKKKLRFPTLNELKELGVTRDWIRYHFGNLEKFTEHILVKNPDILSKYTVKKFNPKNKKNFIITTVVGGTKVNRDFYNALKYMCKADKAELVLLPINNTNSIFDPILKDEFFIFDEISLNSNLHILPININPHEIDPIQGLNRIVKRHTSLIIPSTKLRLKYVPTKKGSLPHAIITPGTISKFDYNENKSKRNLITSIDHTYSALKVKVLDDKYFHFRQIVFQRGKVVDLGVGFSKDGKISLVNGLAILGDLHIGKTDLVFLDAIIKFLKSIDIGTIVLHDAFDAYSISHHDLKKELILGIKKSSGRGSLKKELDEYVSTLKRLLKHFNILIVKSNHDEHLERYLIEGRFMSDYENQKIGLQLAQYIYEGKNPLEMYFKSVVTGNLKHKIHWFERDSSVTFGGSEIAQHGDVGANGSYANIKHLESLYGNIVFGHTHTPEIYRGAWCVGTTTPPFPDYGVGPSSWMQTLCLLYENGSKQLINFINGKLC